ncbi:hypothetical protein RRG08_060388 [Elysia crispata]|uniref:Uncharacterized protein n=1 Tax=Elysia crispata TaxID=231223 RepID=A0AAE0ZGM4_9GAST|nr:hypothetical protein RRG08_060388 [Elysia crispata]
MNAEPGSTNRWCVKSDEPQPGSTNRWCDKNAEPRARKCSSMHVFDIFMWMYISFDSETPVQQDTSPAREEGSAISACPPVGNSVLLIKNVKVLSAK